MAMFCLLPLDPAPVHYVARSLWRNGVVFLICSTQLNVYGDCDWIIRRYENPESRRSTRRNVYLEYEMKLLHLYPPSPRWASSFFGGFLIPCVVLGTADIHRLIYDWYLGKRAAPWDHNFSWSDQEEFDSSNWYPPGTDYISARLINSGEYFEHIKNILVSFMRLHRKGLGCPRQGYYRNRGYPALSGL